MTLDTIMMLVSGITLLACSVTVLYILDENGELDKGAEKMTDWLEKNNTADKFE